MLVQTVLFDGGCKCIHRNTGEPGIKYLLWGGTPSKGSWLNTQGLFGHLISTGQVFALPDCQGPLGGVSWLCVPDQTVWQGAGSMPRVLKSEMPWALSLLNLSGSSVWWHGPLALWFLKFAFGITP